MTEQKCTKCNKLQPTSNFYYRKDKEYLTKRCRVCSNEYVQNYVKNHALLGWKHKRFSKSKLNARKRNIKFELSREQYFKLLDTYKCYYCNEVPQTKSIDRVDNKKGYTESNSVMSCLKCNVMKSTLIKDEIPRMMCILEKVKLLY